MFIHSLRTHAQTFAAFAALAVATGCVDHGAIMRPAGGAEPPTTTPGRVRITFQHHLGASFPAACDSDEIVFVADEAGLLGQLGDATAFDADLAPGRHELYVWIEARLGTALGSPKMTAANVEISEGHRYVVDVGHKPGDLLRGLELQSGTRDRQLRRLTTDEQERRRVATTSGSWLATRIEQGHRAAAAAGVLDLDASAEM